MKLKNEQLSVWLRAVEVPGDLNERLMALAQDSTPPQVWRLRELWGAAVLATAASLLLGWSVFQWQRAGWIPETTLTKRTPPAELKNTDAVAQVGSLWNDFQSTQRLIEIALTSFSVGEVEAKDAVDRPRSWATSLVPSDRTSLIVGMADQAALEWGGDPDRVASDMERLIEQFPSTAGAELAHQYLARSKQQ